MSKKKNRGWKNYVRGLTARQRDKMLMVLLNHLIEEQGRDGPIAYRPFTKAEFADEKDSPECIYWDACGDDILKG